MTQQSDGAHAGQRTADSLSRIGDVYAMPSAATSAPSAGGTGIGFGNILQHLGALGGGGSGTRPIIILTGHSADARAFYPSRNDKSGEIELTARARNAPAGSTIHWTIPPGGGGAAPYAITAPNAGTTRIRALRSGLHELDVTLRDGGGARLASVKLDLSIPQFVTIDEDAAAFDGVLANMMLDHLKHDVLRIMKGVCDHLLRTANVRTIWRMAPFNETLPAHLPAANVTTATIKGEPPAGSPTLFGVTSHPGGGGHHVLAETIEVYPGAYDNPLPGGGVSDTEVDTQTQALAIELESRNVSDPDLEAFALQVYGRLFGETLAHEIVHSLLWTEIPTGHNSPPIPGDLMNAGGHRSFRQRTGFEDTARVSPVDPANFIDHGLASISGLQPVNQARIDNRFPVPPAFR